MFSANAREKKSNAISVPGFRSRVIERFLKIALADDIEGGIHLILPDGYEIQIGPRNTGESAPVLRLLNYRAVKLSLFRGGLGFAEAYINRDIECSDLTALIAFYLRNRARLQASGGRFLKARSLDRLGHRLRRNSLTGSRRNISEHYDLGNDFYEAWLDWGMTYSSGFYRDGAETLEDAQDAKLDRVRALVAATQGQSILEIGCGWGGFACRAARLDRVHVTGLTLSQEQLNYARMRANRAGLGKTCTFHLQDYRTSQGQFDHIVSIEMIEAVGEAYWKLYFQTLHDRLKPGGSAVIQAITISPQYFDAYRQRPDFIQRYIFPGGMLPTKSVIAFEAERAGLQVSHSEQFGRCYARTLRTWRRRFNAAWPKIEKLGFDDRFQRRWLYYLMYCEAGFDDGVIDVGLYKLVK